MKTLTRAIFATICALFVLAFSHAESASAYWKIQRLPGGGTRRIWVPDKSSRRPPIIGGSSSNNSGTTPNNASTGLEWKLRRW